MDISFCFECNILIKDWYIRIAPHRSLLCVCILIKMEDASFPSGGNTTGVNSASSKTDTGRGNGPLPLGGSGLMEEMSALLARRKRIAEKGSTIETTKRDKNEDSEPVTSKASSTVHLNRQENLGKERIQGMAASHLLFPDVILRRKIRSFWPQALWLITQTKLCTLVTGRCWQSPDGGPGLGQIEAGHFRWNKKRIKPKEKLSDAIKPEVSKSNVA